MRTTDIHRLYSGYTYQVWRYAGRKGCPPGQAHIQNKTFQQKTKDERPLTPSKEVAQKLGPNLDGTAVAMAAMALDTTDLTRYVQLPNLSVVHLPSVPIPPHLSEDTYLLRDLA